MPSKQLHNEVLAGGSETAKHHGPEGRNDLKINRKNKFPGGRNVPSEILLEILDCCCCWWLLKQETNRQTPFSKHSRNGETPPNVVPKMTQTQSQEQVPRNVPSEILLEILSYPAIVLESSLILLSD